MIPTGGPSFDIVIPTLGRPSLGPLLGSLAAGDGPMPGTVFVVDDLPAWQAGTMQLPSGGALAPRTRVLRSGGRGPAAARNVGWRASTAGWVAFLDDDVVPPHGWRTALAVDLHKCGPDVGATQGRIHVPLPAGRAATDWERNVGRLANARWATADMAYRREALEAVGGFDERFPSAYREDADLGLRVVGAGYKIIRGARSVEHPVRPADPWVSLRLQRGNADDALMRAKHGPRWRTAACVPRGRRPWHLTTVTAAGTAMAALAARRPRLAAVAALAWAGLTMDLIRIRVTPGPGTAGEVGTMAVTSLAMPFVATWHWLRGTLRWRGLARTTQPAPVPDYEAHEFPSPLDHAFESSTPLIPAGPGGSK